MSDTKHTAGPWRYEPSRMTSPIDDVTIVTEYCIKRDVAFHEVHDLFEYFVTSLPGADEADARLIAAAPELLQAAKDGLSALATPGDLEPEEMRHVQEDLLAAISKAETCGLG
jgi:hypothetical protein